MAKQPDATRQLDFSQAMRRDQFRLRRQKKQIEADAKKGKDVEKRWKGWQQSLQESIETRRKRQQNLPTPELDPELPITARRDEIAAAIRDHQVVVVSGETGSGKSTQLPLICLQLGWGVGGFIGHTQPRRIAARGVASRIAQQTGTRLGEAIGYKIRFGDQTRPETLVKVMTDGMLLAETASDRFLDGYEVIIIDEAHERSLNIDFLMGYIKRLLSKRTDLRILITSATIDTKKFAEHFTVDPDQPVPVIDVEGRTYPVDIEYQPVGLDEEGNEIDQDLESATVAAVRDLAARDRGDMLVFLPTEQSIRSLAKKLRSQSLPGDGGNRTEILPLYARLSTERQNAIFQPGPARRVVLATNVAESSITVPRIHYVIDQGLARISRYAPRSKVQRLPIEAISQASADQRAGRCGRLGPGVCIRLFSEEDFQQRPRYTTPEIRRTNLASVILQTEALRLGAIDEFPFIESPKAESIRDGYKTLFEIGAVDGSRKLTSLGKKLSRFPVDPRIGRMLVAASDNGCLAEVLVIAAALEIQDPRVRPAERQAAADQAHAQFVHEESDFLGMLKLWQWLHERRESLSRSKFRKACGQNFLSYMLVQQWMDVYRQLRSLARDHGLHYGSDKDNDEAIHRSLLTGLLSGVAMKSDRHEYTGAGGIKFFLWPGSGVVKAADGSRDKKNKRTGQGRDGKSSPSLPSWILVAEIVETTRRFGRTVARIDPKWIEPLAEHVLKRSYFDPYWSKKRQSAMGHEKATLFGLPVVNRRPIRYGSIDPETSRQLLIEEGLVGDQMKQEPGFLVHNRQVLEEAQTMAAKTRERQWVVDDYRVQAFYEDRLPDDIVDGGQLIDRIKRDRSLDERLRLTMDDLKPEDAETVGAEDFPSELEIGDLRLPIEYRFTPGAEDDGVNVRVPLQAVSQVHENHLGWSVPGLLPSRIKALIRSLPKPIRRQLVPAPETAEAVAERIEFGVGSFWDVVAKQLSEIAGEPITPDMFNRQKLDDSQKINLQVCDDEGNVIAQARDLETLKAQLPEGTVETEVEVEADHPWREDGLTDWEWGEFPKQIVVRRGVAEVPLFPTIVDAGDAVNLRLFDNRERSNRLTRLGLATLYRLNHRKPIQSQVNWIPDLDKLEVIANRLPNAIGEFRSMVAQLISRVAFVEGKPIPRSREDFDARQANAAERIGIATQKIAPWLKRLLESYQRVCVQLESLPSTWSHVRDDIQRQWDHLFPVRFLESVPWVWLEQYPRFLQAVEYRLDRSGGGGGSLEKDREATEELSPLYDQFEARQQELEKQGTIDPELEWYGWLLQEYRVSLFAQKLGTSEKVSPQRLEKQWKKIR